MLIRRTIELFRGTLEAATFNAEAKFGTAAACAKHTLVSDFDALRAWSNILVSAKDDFFLTHMLECLVV